MDRTGRRRTRPGSGLGRSMASHLNTLSEEGSMLHLSNLSQEPSLNPSPRTLNPSTLNSSTLNPTPRHGKKRTYSIPVEVTPKKRVFSGDSKEVNNNLLDISFTPLRSSTPMSPLTQMEEFSHRSMEEPSDSPSHEESFLMRPDDIHESSSPEEEEPVRKLKQFPHTLPAHVVSAMNDDDWNAYFTQHLEEFPYTGYTYAGLSWDCPNTGKGWYIPTNTVFYAGTVEPLKGIRRFSCRQGEPVLGHPEWFPGDDWFRGDGPKRTLEGDLMRTLRGDDPKRTPEGDLTKEPCNLFVKKIVSRSSLREREVERMNETFDISSPFNSSNNGPDFDMDSTSYFGVPSLKSGTKTRVKTRNPWNLTSWLVTSVGLVIIAILSWIILQNPHCYL